MLETDIEDNKFYNNMAIVVVEGKRWETVNLSIPAYTADFQVIQQRNFADEGELDLTLSAGTSTTQMVVEGKVWYQLGLIVGTGLSHGNTGLTSILTRSVIQGKLPVGAVVHNITRDTWSYITSYINSKQANTTMVSGTATHQTNDIFEFHEPPDEFNVRNVTQAVWRGITNYNYTFPDTLVHNGITGQVPGQVVNIYRGGAGWQWDEKGFNTMIAFPTETSDPPSTTQINIFNKSDYALNFLIKWRI